MQDLTPGFAAADDPRAHRGETRVIWKRLAERMRGSAAATVASRWGGLASDEFVRDLERVSWTGIAQVHLNHNYLITGKRTWYWIDWIRDRFFPRNDAGPGNDAGDTLSLGCGAGHLDRVFKQYGVTFRSFTGIDISEAAIERARTLAQDVQLAPVIRYSAMDLNRIELPPERFDFIYFFQSLHHIEALEHVLDQCRRALRPGGLLLVNEFVGPSRFQWTDRQLEMANALVAALPADLRRDLSRGGVKEKVERPTVEQMVKHDPSEAVRSAEIEGLVKARFDVVGEWNWGGTLNHLVFQDIAANFDTANPSHNAIVELLIQHENTVVREGILPSDFKVFLAR